MQLVMPIRSSLTRQVNHWLQAASRLSAIDHLASGYAWQGIDHKVGVLLRQYLQESVGEVIVAAEEVKRQLDTVTEDVSFRSVKKAVMALRDKYLKAEETIHFYTVAINSRTTPNIAALLRACDILCIKSMQQLLQPLGKATPPVLTYVEKGVGASILKAGLRLWDGRISPVAAIKITQHNLFRPTAIIHETGHQVAHILGWTEELADTLSQKLDSHPKLAGAAFAGWASEIAADAFAFVHTGYASVAALHDVVSGSVASVFAYHMHDPHPISYIRVLMNIQMCRLFYGQGAWDELEISFKNDYNLAAVDLPSIGLVRICESAIQDVVQLILKTSYRCFGNRSLSQMVDPMKAGPLALHQMELSAGAALYTSHAWIWNESIRLLALNGYRIGLGKGDLAALYRQQEEWMIKLGFSVEMN